jgi:hypothetical protein
MLYVPTTHHGSFQGLKETFLNSIEVEVIREKVEQVKAM